MTAFSTPLASDIVLGTGVLGLALAHQLRATGRSVTLVNRHGGRFDGFDALACPADRLRELTARIDAPIRLFVCAAPAYDRWPQEFPALIDGIIAATAGHRVDIVYADNLYAYGESDQPFSEDSPYRAHTVKGRVRAVAAERLMALHGPQGPVRVAIMRGSSFFGPGVKTSAFGADALRAVLAGKPANMLGDPTRPHALSYLPDFATALLRAADESAAFGHTWHVPNSPARGLVQWLADVGRLGGQPAAAPPRTRTAGRLLLRVMGLFNPAMREMVEMLYLFERPVLVDHRRTAARLGLTPTPPDRALGETLAWLRTAS